MLYFRNNIHGDVDILRVKCTQEFSAALNAFNEFTEIVQQVKQDRTEAGGIIAEGTVKEELAVRFNNAMDDIMYAKFYNPLLIMAYSAFDYSLFQTRVVFQFYFKEPKFNKAEGLGLEKYINYIRNVIGFDISASTHYATIDQGRKVRNLITHNAGNIIKNFDLLKEEQEDYELINTNSKLHLSESAYVFIRDVQYVKEFYDASSAVIIELLNHFRERVYKPVK